LGIDNGQFVGKPPKAKVGIRTVSFPHDLSPELRWHIERSPSREAQDGALLYDRRPERKLRSLLSL
jgi:hypothetical protein